MQPNEFKFKSYLEIASLDIVTNELKHADLSDCWVTDKLISQIFSLLNALDMETEDGIDFDKLIDLYKALLGPLIETGYIFLNYTILEDKPFFIIAADNIKAKEILTEGDDGVHIDDLLIDAHADVAPYTQFYNGESIKKIDSEGNEYVFGRGANDMLTQNAVLILLLYRLYRSNIKPPFITISTDEEGANPDQRKFYKKIYAPAAISLEPTGNLIGGYVNEILEGISYKLIVKNLSILTSEELNSKLNKYFKEKPAFKEFYISSCFRVQNILSVSISPNNLNTIEEERFVYLLRYFLEANSIQVERIYIYDPWETFHSIISPKMKDTLLYSLNSIFGEAKLVENPLSSTTVIKNSEIGSYSIANFFQCSLGLYLPTKSKNSVILSFPERGGRHNDTEHFKVGEPSMLLEALFYIVNNLKVSELEG